MAKLIRLEEVYKQLDNAYKICDDCVMRGEYCVGCDITYQIRKHKRLIADFEKLERGFKNE